MNGNRHFVTKRGEYSILYDRDCVLTAGVDGGRRQAFSIEKVKATLRKNTFGLDTRFVRISEVAAAVDRGKKHHMSSEEVQSLAARAAADLANQHPDYLVLAGRLEVANIHRVVPKSFQENVLRIESDNPGFFDPAFLAAVAIFGDAFDSYLRHDRDVDTTYFAIQTMKRLYLLRVDARCVERPQHMWMRVSVALHRGDVDSVIETYEALSAGRYTHATPTLINAGRARQGLASCFISSMDWSSPERVLDGMRDLGNIFMHDGGIGLDMHRVPAKRWDDGHDQPGALAAVRLVDAVAKYTTDARNTRSSSVSPCIPMWHADVMEVIEIRTLANLSSLAIDFCFPSVVIPDIFMERVQVDGMWSMFDPLDVPELADVHGAEFSRLYMEYEEKGVAARATSARSLMRRIIHAQIESGTPFVLYGDSINAKNNQAHVGVVHSTNLCTEIVQVATPSRTAVCILASVVLPAFVQEDGTIDLDGIRATVKVIVRNLDRVIEVNDYPTDAARAGAMSARALGIGVQGLADVFRATRTAFDSDQARSMSIAISQAVYFAALEASCDLARTEGAHPDWRDEHRQAFRFQFEMWGVQPPPDVDVERLRQDIDTHGLRHSMLTAQMPTASTSQLWGASESVDPLTSNVFVRRVLGGEFQVMCRYMVKELNGIGLWTQAVRDAIVSAHGSVQAIADIPDNLKAVFKTAWELPQRAVLDMAIARGPYIDQSQSTTVYMRSPTMQQMYSMHMYGWKGGLKTGLYYLRSGAATYGSAPILSRRQLEADLAPDACSSGACGA
ncbi:alpha subunit of ribonucleoside diphosphate reductase [Earliella scabrosa]|nr:alpha subunit of ribonucleoside diphosphate reductase [Earliella scabrosa]